MMDLVHKHKIHTQHPEWYEAKGLTRPSFRKGEITLFYETSAKRVITWAQDIGGLDKMYVSPPPTQKQAFTIAFGRQFTQFKTEPAREEAGWGFLRWLTSTDGLAHYSAGTMFMPARRSILTHPKWLAVMKIAPAVPDLLGPAGIRLPAVPSDAQQGGPALQRSDAGDLEESERRAKDALRRGDAADASAAGRLPRARRLANLACHISLHGASLALQWGAGEALVFFRWASPP